MEAQLERILHITKQTLAFYRERRSPSLVDICDSLEHVLRLLRAEPAFPSVTFQTECDRLCVVPIYSDELMQLFSNLLRNAAEAGSSKVRIRVALSHSWRDSRNEGVRITVCDDGTGVERQNFSRLFEPFYTTKEAKGTGLGLWVCKGVVEKHEGRIAVRSSTQCGRRGTVISIFLPSAISGRQTEHAA